MVYFHKMQNFIALLAMVLICLTAVSLASDNPVILGVEFPAPADGDWPAEGEKIYYTPYPLQFDIVFYLSSEGGIDSIYYPPQPREVFIESILGVLKKLRFYPARVNDTVVPFILPGVLEFRPEGKKAGLRLHVPFDEPECKLNNRLVDEALALNGFRPPGLEEYPSYYCLLPGTENDKPDYPFIAYDVMIDSSGKLIDYNIISRTRDVCSRLMSNVLSHARFTPASHHGRVLASRLYVIVRLFDQMNYPTKAWTPRSGLEGSDLFEHYRIETALTIDSVVCPPFPINIPGGVFLYNSAISVRDSVEVAVNIGLNGEIDSYEYYFLFSDNLRRVADEILRKLKFTPAMLIDGRMSDYQGKLYIKFDNSNKIRIELKWLPYPAADN